MNQSTYQPNYFQSDRHGMCNATVHFSTHGCQNLSDVRGHMYGIACSITRNHEQANEITDELMHRYSAWTSTLLS